jgi:hypothetical protein
MKILKFIGVAIFMVAVFLACKKTADDPLGTAAANGVDLKNGIVTFKSTADYLAATENKKGEQTNLIARLKENMFRSLRQLPLKSAPSFSNRINEFTNAFDTSLYSNYLLSILNQDKICSINGYLVKVDMDNVFCSVIDQTQYASESADLVNNVFSNPHIMTFVNPDEPVLEVLTRMRNNQLTWPQYQDSLAKKGGQGICFKSGARAEEKNVVIPYGTSGDIISAVAEYGKYFLHFELLATGYAKRNWAFSYAEMTFQYEYTGVCNGGGAGTKKIVTNQKSLGLLQYTIYSGGSALSMRKLRVTTKTPFSTNQTAVASIGY